jgi:hypothetical protein
MVAVCEFNAKVRHQHLQWCALPSQGPNFQMSIIPVSKTSKKMLVCNEWHSAGGGRQVGPQLQRMGLPPGPPAYGHGHPHLGMQPQGAGNEHAGRPWGQKISGNDKYNEWKLFVGQVPLEVHRWLSCPEQKRKVPLMVWPALF